MNEENISNEDLEAGSNNTFDLALRPKKLDDFIGQKKVQGNLSTFIKAASDRDEPMDHILLHGPRVGKNNFSTYRFIRIKC